MEALGKIQKTGAEGKAAKPELTDDRQMTAIGE